MKKVLLSVSLLVLGTLATQAQSDATKAEIRTNIDWIWNVAGNAPPASLNAWRQSVPLGNGSRAIRGPIGAKDCGNHAVLFAMAGYSSEAIEWLQVAQSHNGHVMELFAQYPDYTRQYAVDRYAKDALAFGGLSVLSGGTLPYSAIRSGIEWFKKHHRPSNDPEHFKQSTVEHPAAVKTPGDRIR